MLTVRVGCPIRLRRESHHRRSFDAAPLIAARRGVPMKTTRERADEKRQEKLDHVREQVDSGSLVIRQMTDDERERYPLKPPRPKRSYRS
jgi:hypothetical protein